MEFSDNEEEIIDLNAEKDKSKEEKKMEKSKSRSSSSKNIKWVKSSLESLSQMAKNEVEETEYEENTNLNHNEENIYIDNDNEGENQEKLSNYDNNNNIDNNYNNYNKYNDFTEKTEETHADSNAAKNKQSFYTFIWDEGGENVKLIGSFSNWKQKYVMEKDEKGQIYKFSLPLNNEKYQYKFIVDGVWKCSNNQEKIDDGKGNINNILDLTNTNNQQKEEIKKKNISKKGSKIEYRKTEVKKKKEKKISNANLKKEKQKKAINKKEYGNLYPDRNIFTEPNYNDTIGKAFNINNESKQKKMGNSACYKFEPFNSYSSNKSYLNLSTYRHTILNHMVFQKKVKKKFKIKIGIISRYREKATTFIYFNCFSKKDI